MKARILGRHRQPHHALCNLLDGEQERNNCEQAVRRRFGPAHGHRSDPCQPRGDREATRCGKAHRIPLPVQAGEMLPVTRRTGGRGPPPRGPDLCIIDDETRRGLAEPARRFGFSVSLTPSRNKWSCRPIWICISGPGRAHARKERSHEAERNYPNRATHGSPGAGSNEEHADASSPAEAPCARRVAGVACRRCARRH